MASKRKPPKSKKKKYDSWIRKQCPIQHLSYSALTTYLRNPWQFKKTYIDKVYDDKDSPASVVGRAFHKCMELYYSGAGRESAIEGGRQLLSNAAPNVDWGKTGSVEKSMRDYHQTVDHYFDDPDIQFKKEDVVATEYVMKVKVHGIQVPIKAVSDLIIRTDVPHWKKGKCEKFTIVDFKKVSALPGPDDPIPAEYYIQAAFNYWALTATQKITTDQYKPDRIDTMVFSVLFVLVKTSVNKDKSPQTMMIELPIANHQVQKHFRVIKKMAQRVVHQISRLDNNWFPNISDMYANPDAWEEFVEVADGSIDKTGERPEKIAGRIAAFRQKKKELKEVAYKSGLEYKGTDMEIEEELMQL